MRYITALLLIFYCSFNYAQITKITVWESLYNTPSSIMMNYLHRALQVTIPEYGDYQLQASEQMEQGRALIELGKLKNSQLDIATFAPTKEREEQAIPIRIPVLNGLMGYRLCLIKASEQPLFNTIKNKQQLITQNITIGQHQNWPDTAILRSNNINVITTYKKKLLFQQLIRGRFNCFSRGASEIFDEYLQYKKKGIAIENNLLIHYPLPIFFFVNKSQPLLAQRLQLGLEKLIDSGEFDTIFKQFFLPINDKLKLDKRTVIHLNNPTLSSQTIEKMRVPTQRFEKQYLKIKTVISPQFKDLII